MMGSLHLLCYLIHGSSNTFSDEEVLECQNKAMCRCHFLFQDVCNYEHVDVGVKCLRCDICAEKCDCGKCTENHIPLQVIRK